MWITTKEEYESLKSRDKIIFKCDKCNKEYFRPKNYIQACIKRKTQYNCCSLHCYNSRDKILIKCLKCGKETYNKKYCSGHCAAAINNKTRILNKSYYKIKKKAICKTCKKEILVSSNSNILNVNCVECRTKSRKLNYTNYYDPCMICGEYHCSKRICAGLKVKKFREKMINVFGLPVEVIGTKNVFIELDKIKNILYDKYIIEEKSNTVLAEEYHLNSASNIKDLLKFFDIPRRNISQGLRVAFRKGRSNPPKCGKSMYKQDWHITWDNKKVFLRSSFELEIAKQLDNKKILYEVEALRISYISHEGYEKIYIPDFYIPSKNKILEVKSDYTYQLDKNINLKIQKCKELGYEFDLIVGARASEVIATV